MTRNEHLQWSKDRALVYCDNGDVTQAYSSMVSDMHKHEDTAKHAALELGLMLMMGGQLSTPEQMRKFINGFN